MSSNHPSAVPPAAGGSRARRARVGIMLAAVVAIAACTQQPAPTPGLVVLAPDSVYSGTSFEAQAVIDRAEVMTGAVTVSLAEGVDGFTATAVSTDGDAAELEIEVDASVAPDSYDLSVTATDGTRTVTDEVTVEVLGPQPATIDLELRSLMLPTPGDIGFPLPPVMGDVASVSLVPGDDVPAAYGQARAVPGEFVVRFAAGSAPAAGADLVADGVRFTPVAAFGAGSSVQLVKTDTALSVDDAVALAARLEARSDVISASPNWLFNVHQATPRYELQWHYPTIGLHNAWGAETGETEQVVVGVLDTGYKEHPDLAGLFLPGYDFAYDDADPVDGGVGFSHGTHVSGTIAMDLANDPEAAGINRGARILPVKVLDDDGNGTFLGMLFGMLWATGVPVDGYDLSGLPENENLSRVLNLSLGGRAGGCPDEMAYVTQILAEAGIVIVVSAGNDGQDIRHYAPASCPGVISVGASGPYDYRASYSNFGAIDITAPGGDVTYSYVSESLPGGILRPAGVLSPGDDEFFYYAQGTSMAAPHVTGVASLLLANDPSLSAAAVKDLLVATATPLTATQCGLPDVAGCGAGLLNAAAALGVADPGPWPGASVATADLYACTTEDCSDLGPDSEPLATLSTALTRGYTNFSFADLAAGTYYLEGYVESVGVHPALEFLLDGRVVSVAAGEVADVVLEAWPLD